MREYPISEDTVLMLRNIKCGKNVLDMGTGSGIIAIECARRGSRVTAVDIDEIAVKKLRERAKKENLKVDVIKSDLFENIKGKFDTIIFNPPYLPGDAQNILDLQWAGGGEYGDKIIIHFLEEANKFLNGKGEIYIILSSFNRLERIEEMKYDFELIDKMKLSFHEIFIYKLKWKSI